MSIKAKVKVWDVTALFMGFVSLIAGMLLAFAYVWQIPVAKFYAEITLMTFLPIIIIYLWTEKVVEWMKVNSRILDAIALLVRIVAIIMFVTFAGSRIIAMYKDIPYAITSNYAYAKGKPVRAITQSGTRSRMYLAVNGVRFHVGEKVIKNINRNANCNITYLPHSKYVIDINQDTVIASEELK